MNKDWFIEQARSGNVYHSCSTGAVTLSTVSATCTGLVLSNPIGSGVNVVLKEACFTPSTAPAGAAVVGLAISPSIAAIEVVHTTPAVIHNAITTGSNADVGKAKVDAAATLAAAPVWFKPLGSVVAASSITPDAYIYEFDGTIILPPGTNISFSYLTTAAVGIASFTWAEVKE